jgi:hypothetical protein
VKINWKILRWVFPAFLLLSAGCSGINMSKSVSPATFLLPGLLQADPPPANPDREFPADAPVQQVAQAQ